MTASTRIPHKFRLQRLQRPQRRHRQRAHQSDQTRPLCPFRCISPLLILSPNLLRHGDTVITPIRREHHLLTPRHYPFCSSRLLVRVPLPILAIFLNSVVLIPIAIRPHVLRRPVWELAQPRHRHLTPGHVGMDHDGRVGVGQFAPGGETASVHCCSRGAAALHEREGHLHLELAGGAEGS